MDRANKLWRQNLRVVLQTSDLTMYDKLQNQISQLAEWRRQASCSTTPKAASAQDNIVQLIEATSQAGDGLILPRTERDEMASEDNCGVMQLLTLHMVTEERLHRGIQLPTRASQTQAMGSKTPVANFIGNDVSAVQVTVEANVTETLAPLKQEAFIRMSVWDSANNAFFMDDSSLITLTRDAVASGTCYLVFRLFRRGSLIDSRKRPDTATYTRPLGVAVAKIPPVLLMLAEGSPYKPPPLVFMRPSKNDDARFFLLHRSFVETPQLLSQFNRVSLVQTLPLAIRCRGLPDEITDMTRDDLVLRLRRGTFSQDNKIAQRNVQVRVHVVSDSSEVIPSILPGNTVGDTSPAVGLAEYRSAVYHCNSPVFEEVIHIKIPQQEQFERCHLLFTFWHASSQEVRTHMFAFGSLALAGADGVAIEDGLHSIKVFKPTPAMEKGSLTMENLLPRKDVFEVETKLQSDYKTNIPELHTLKKWQTTEQAALMKALQQLRFLADESQRCLRCLSLLFDSLFDLLVSCDHTRRQLRAESFNLLVSIINKLFATTATPSSLRVLDTYLSKRFYCPSLYQTLMPCIRTALAGAQSLPSLLVLCRLCAKSFEHHLALLHIRGPDDAALAKTVSDFRASATDMFRGILSVLQRRAEGPSSDPLVAAQTTLLRHFHRVTSCFSAVFSRYEIRSLLEAALRVSPATPAPYEVGIAQLQLAVDIVQSGVELAVKKGEAGPAINFLCTICQVLLNRFNAGGAQRALSFRIVQRLIGESAERGSGAAAPSQRVWCLTLLLAEVAAAINHVLDGVDGMDMSQIDGGEKGCVAALLGIIWAIPDEIAPCMFATIAPLRHRIPVLDDKPAQSFRLELCLQLLQTSMHLLSVPCFPSSWLSMNMLMMSAIRKLYRWVTLYLESRSSDWQGDFAGGGMPVWDTWSDLTIALLTSPLYAPEYLSRPRRRFVEDRYGEQRPEICRLFRTAWAAASATLRLKLAPRLVAPALDLMHCGCTQVAELSRGVYMDLIRAELQVRDGKLPLVERLTIDAIDVLVVRKGRSNRISEYLTVEYYLNDVDKAAESEYDAVLRNQVVVRFLSEARTLHSMLSSVSKYPATPEFEGERASAALTLISYLRRTHRIDMYTKYVSFLRDLHRQLSNGAEAALSHLLHADILEWSDKQLPAVWIAETMLFASQTSSERLESIMQQAIRELRAVQCWEDAIRLITVLCQRYHHTTYEYSKLASLLQLQASIFEDIARKPRVFASYFLVTYSGGAFAKLYRNKVFIYRGSPGERMADFDNRLFRKWVGASRVPIKLDSILSSSRRDDAHPDPNMEIGIAAVTIVPCVPVHPLYGPPQACVEVAPDRQRAQHMPQWIRQGREQTGVKYFVYQKTFRMRAVKTHNEHLDSWISRCYLTSSEAFPATIRLSEVVAAREFILNPIEAAVLLLEDHNVALLDVIERSAAGPDRGANQDFSSKLQGVVDAPLSGGIANYKPFLTGDFKITHPEINDDIEAHPETKGTIINRLREALMEQFRIVARGIRVHATKCAVEMIPLHDFLCTRFDSMRITMKELGVYAESVESE